MISSRYARIPGAHPWGGMVTVGYRVHLRRGKQPGWLYCALRQREPGIMIIGWTVTGSTACTSCPDGTYSSASGACPAA
jgi:hypothetical protein